MAVESSACRRAATWVSASLAEITSGCSADMRPCRVAVRSCASTRPSFSRRRAGCESSRRLGAAISRVGSAWASLEQGQQLPIGLLRGAELPQLVLDFRNRVAERRVAGVRIQQRAKLRQIAADLLLQGSQLRGRGLQVDLGHLHGLVQFVDHALRLGIADPLQMELQLTAQGRTERRDPCAVLVADLQVEDLRGAELHALGRDDLSGLLQAFDVVVAGPGGSRAGTMYPWSSAGGPTSSESRLEYAVALGQLQDGFLDVFQVFGCPRNLPGSISPPPASLRTIRACEACQVLGATRA